MMKFVKIQTNGNDFVVIEKNEKTEQNVNLAKIANRKYGVGADQVIFIGQKNQNTAAVEFFNQDGSLAKMCGNGACAVAFYLNKRSQNTQKKFCLNIFETAYEASVDGNKATVFFKSPVFVDQIPLSKHDDKLHFVTNGNKHLVCQVEDVNSVQDFFAKNLAKLYNEYNIHFVKRINHDTLKMRSFERGVGWTLACGSGAVAAAFAMQATETKVFHDGGVSFVSVKNGAFSLTTEPKLIFEGELLCLCQEYNSQLTTY